MYRFSLSLKNFENLKIIIKKKKKKKDYLLGQKEIHDKNGTFTNLGKKGILPW